MLKLKSLRIDEELWGTNKGKFKGEIEYHGEAGKITLSLNHEDCKKLLPVVAAAIVAASREVAENLTAEAIASTEQPKVEAA